MKIIILLMSFMFTTEATASNLTFNQQHVKNVAKYVGSKNCVQDMCFSKTLKL
jgi:hypothetical protein